MCSAYPPISWGTLLGEDLCAGGEPEPPGGGWHIVEVPAEAGTRAAGSWVSCEIGPRSGDHMDDEARESAFMSALVTEHFVLQSAASTTVSEAGTRASLFLYTLSSSLIAMGFVSQSPDLLVPFVATVIPAVLAIGIFTIVRLVDTGVQNIALLSRIGRIRGYYRTLGPHAPVMFRPWGESDGHGATEALATLSLRRSWLLGLFTTASMVAVVNSLVAGIGVALAARWIMGAEWIVVAILLGLLATAVHIAAFLVYQDRRYRALEPHLEEGSD